MQMTAPGSRGPQERQPRGAPTFPIRFMGNTIKATADESADTETIDH